jgi:CDP-glucose 4,6-dehydratase
MRTEFWRGKKVFVTGHTGFKGSWLSLWLHNAGAIVTGYSLEPPTKPSMYEAVILSTDMTSVINDILRFDNVISAIKQSGAEIVIHMAAQSLVRESYLWPVDTYATNIMGTVNVLEAVRQSGTVKAILVVTSDKCYENKNTQVNYREDDPMGGYDPYSSSKGCAELVTSAYRDSFFSGTDRNVVVASARSGNVIGGGDWSRDRLIPDLVRAMESQQTVKIRNPGATRPWQHVLEPLNGYLTLIEHMYESGTDDYASGWNFGPTDTDAKTVAWVIDKALAIWGEGASWENEQFEQPHEAKFLNLDSNKARDRLQWQPKLSIDIALQWTVDWYKAYMNKQDMRDITLNQINLYQELN